MERSTRVLFGGLLLAAGIGGGILLYNRERNSSSGTQDAFAGLSATTDPPQPLPSGQHPVTVTINWVNQSGAPVAYAVQGAVVQALPVGVPGLIGGHWWVSQQALDAAVAAGNPSPLETHADLRVVRGTAQPGEHVSVKFFSRPMLVPGETWLFWIDTSPPAQGLLVQDPVGTDSTNLKNPRLILPVGVH